MAEEPDGAWVAVHLTVTSLDDEHGGGVAVEVESLAREGAEADVDVAKTGAWLQAHGGEVKAFEAMYSACGCAVCTVCVLCTCGTLTLDVWLSWLLFGAGVRRARFVFTPAQDGTRPGGMHDVDTIEVARYVFGATLLSCAVVWRTSASILAPFCSCWRECAGTQDCACCVSQRCTVVLFVLMRGIVWYGVYGIRQCAT